MKSLKLISTYFKTLIILFIIIGFTACKKNYSCSCGSPYIDTEPVIIKDTKKNAEKNVLIEKRNYKIKALMLIVV